MLEEMRIVILDQSNGEIDLAFKVVSTSAINLIEKARAFAPD